MKILTVIGARPQFVKAAVVSRAIQWYRREYADDAVEEVLVHTGQHFDDNMSEVFFRQLGIPLPGYQLGIGGGRHGQMTGRMLEAIEQTILAEKPDVLLVYGDTNSTLAGALAAAKLHVPIAHVEAGLRSYNRRMSEEVNRVLTDHAADLLFAPTEAAVENLRREGVDDARIHLVGDVMYDAAMYYGAQADHESSIIERLGLRKGGFALATVHRAENTDDRGRLVAIFDALLRLAEQLPVVLPVHPRTRKAAFSHGISLASTPLILTEPLGYLDMLKLERDARIVITDSGGVQKEAFFQRVPCVTLRDESEWMELVRLGWNHLVPPREASSILAGIQAAMAAPAGQEADPYGEGDAGRRIAVSIIERQAGALVSTR